MRYAIALTSALLLGGATATLALHGTDANAQVAQNEPGTIAAAAPKPGAPMSFADMVAKLQPAVVNISTKQTITVQQNANPFAGTPFGDLFGQLNGGGGNGAPVKREGASLGSGFLISADGYIVTNNHVISAGTRGATVDSITVTLQDRKEYVAKLVGRDPTSDLAVLKITAPAPLPFVKMGDSGRARVGDWVVAIGQPFGLGGTVTAGIVSAVHRSTGGGPFDSFIQTDAAINQGNSGGPMFNLNGDVIGINSQIYSQTGGNIGIGFAIPATEAKPIIDTLMKGGSVSRGYIGIGLGGPVTDDVSAALGIPKNVGELVARVEPNGPAAKGGLRAGDVVTSVNGKQINPDNTLSRSVADLRPGGTARFEVVRDGRQVTVSVTPTLRPSEDQLAATLNGGDDGGFGANGDDNSAPGAQPSAFGALGLDVVPVTPAIANAIGVAPGTKGVAVRRTDPGSDAGQKLQPKDVITVVNNTPVATAEDLGRAVAAAKAAGRDRVMLIVMRQRNTGAVTVKLKN